MKFSISRTIATFFYASSLPKAPASWGSFFALPCAWYLWALPWPLAYTLFGLSVAAAVWASGVYERQIQSPDSRYIVVDEAVGMCLALVCAKHSWQQYLLAFFLFRVFDNWKPFPISQLEKRIPGGFGIVIDDLIAGLYVAILFFFGNLH